MLAVIFTKRRAQRHKHDRTVEMVIISGLITPLRLLQTERTFFHCDANKDNFFKLLASEIEEFKLPAEKQMVSTHGPNAV